MPNYVELIASAAELSKFDAKAGEWGLPRVMVFSAKAGQTSSTLKALSAEYRRRVLIGELKGQRAELAAAIKAHGVTSFPTLLCVPPGEHAASIRFENKEPTYRRLESFVGKCALRKPVVKKPTSAAANEGKEEL